MNWMRWVEFFEDSNNRLSMTRLLCFMSFFPSSYVVVRNYDKSSIPEILGIYVGSYVLGYIGGKFADRPAPVTVNQQSAVNNVDASAN